MSIQVRKLTKVYGTQRAVQGLDFEVSPGEIVGFLGPNGAGKSTTMKILTGYLQPSQGEVKIKGYDILSQPKEAKREIGYLPEHNPLYLDMYVREFLTFVGELYGLKGQVLRSRVEEMVEQCGLTVERRKKIGQLSKGYRQRVGLAQAFLHEPSVLILDEPTTGLDPNQLVEIRELIRTLGQNKTVLFSTHIMQEVEALCSRVLVINRGTLVANTPLDTLKASGKSLETIFKELTQ